MRFTIERIRTLVLAAGLLLVVVLAAFLAIGKWKRPFNRRDLPKRLGIDIQQEAKGVTYTQSHGGHTIFKIHASKVVQLKNDEATLHDVRIELYGQNSNIVDRIQGDEFEYDQKTGIATAAGPVEITLMRPTASPRPAGSGKAKAKMRAEPSPNREIQVKTSGLVFNEQTGIASTAQRVDFSSAEGSGTAMGATYNSDQGLLILDRAVELTTRQGTNPVELHARHAEFDRNTEVGHLRGATAETHGKQASAAAALIDFRADGTIERLDASGGVTVSTAAGSHLAAPRGTMLFNGENQPRSGRFEGGVTMASVNDSRQLNGTSPVMTLEFNSAGELRHAHLERGVEMEETGTEGPREQENKPVRFAAAGENPEIPVRITRTWRSPVADVDFRQAASGRVEPVQVHGKEGVVLTGETRRGSQPPVPSRLAADEITGLFGPQSTLTLLTGIGHSSMEETAANGARQTATGDRLQARFVPVNPAQGPEAPRVANSAAAWPAGASAPQAQIQSAELEGHVTLFQQPAAKPGAKLEPPLRATAGRAIYESAGQWLHLTIHPRVEDGGMELTAGKVDVSQASGDAFAHGDVKATWIEALASGDTTATGSASPVTMGGKGPVHAIAAEAELHQPTGKTTFNGHARLWQQENSISAPIIVIFRQSGTLTANTTNPSEPVIAVMLNAGAEPAGSVKKPAGHTTVPSVVWVRGGNLWYSDAERKAIMRAYPLPAVTAQADGVESTSAQVELYLAPSGVAKQTAGAASAQVERINALGHVVLTSQDRRGAGEKLAYTSSTGTYILTGTPSSPPRLTDPQRGTVTGAALIFNSRDDSVSIEGGGHETTTETTMPRRGRD